MKYNKILLEKNHGSKIVPGMYSDKVIEVNDLAKINNRYMGGGMSQNWFALPFFEYWFDSNRFEYIVEFGSQKGCLSTYFANMAGITESFFFETYELFPDKSWDSRSDEGCGHWYKKLAEISPYINFFHKDVFSEGVKAHITENISEFKTMIFCDGGNKIDEFNMYAPILKPGDKIAVHDWGHEIHQHNIQATLDKYNLIKDEYFAETARDLHTQIMPFKKI